MSFWVSSPRVAHATHEDFDAVLEGALASSPVVYVVYMAAVKPDTGLMWCPDCVRAEPLLLDALPGTGAHVVYVTVEREAYRSPDYPLRVHSGYALTAVPTLVRWTAEGGAGAALVENEVNDAGALAAFLSFWASPRVSHATHEDFDAVLEGALASSPVVYVVYMAAVKPDTGLMWCPDCVRAEPLLLDALPGTGAHIVYVTVEREAYRSPDYPLRVHSGYALTAVPTLVRWTAEGGAGAALVENEVNDAAGLAAFLAAE